MAKALHILLVDDEPEICEILGAILQEEGHTTDSSGSGVEAFMKLQSTRKPFDLLITDHYMPGSLPGLGLARVARAKGFSKSIMVMSGRLTPELKESYKPFRPLGFLPKPFDLKLLGAFLDVAMRVSEPAPAPPMARWLPAVPA